jgi:hypothetical protein
LSLHGLKIRANELNDLYNKDFISWNRIGVSGAFTVLCLKEEKYMKQVLTFLLIAILPFTVMAGGFTLVPGSPLKDSAAIYDVSGRQGLLIRQRLQFGPFSTPFVKRGAITGWTVPSGFLSRIWVQEHVAKQSIRYTLTDGTDTAEAIARTGVHRTSLIVGANPNSLPNVINDVLMTGTEMHQNNLSVALTLPGYAAPWELFLDNNAAQLMRHEPAGYLRGETEIYTIVPVWRVSRKGKEANLPFGTAGLEFRNSNGDVLAAVNLMNNGVVHLAPNLPASQRLLLATACSSLLLQSQID